MMRVCVCVKLDIRFRIFIKKEQMRKWNIAKKHEIFIKKQTENWKIAKTIKFSLTVSFSTLFFKCCNKVESETLNFFVTFLSLLCFVHFIKNLFLWRHRICLRGAIRRENDTKERNFVEVITTQKREKIRQEVSEGFRVHFTCMQRQCWWTFRFLCVSFHNL